MTCRLNYRTFAEGDAERIEALWNRCLDADRASGKAAWWIDQARLAQGAFAKRIDNPSFSPEAVVVAGRAGELIGFAMVVVRAVPRFEGQDLDALPAYLPAILVRHDARRAGIGSELLARVERYALDAGKDELHMKQDSPVSFVCGVMPETAEAAFLTARGFELVGLEHRLRLEFDRYSAPTSLPEIRKRLNSEGIVVRRYEPEDYDSFSSLMCEYFRRWWRLSYEPNLKRDEPKPVLVALDGKRVVGFVGFVSVSEAGRAGFSPGVHSDYRGRKIGKLLLHTWCEEVIKLGAKHSVISTGVKNWPAKHIYEELGYQNLGVFHWTAKKKLRIPVT